MAKKKKIIIGVAGGLAVLAVILAFVFLRGDEKAEIKINADTTQQGPVQITTSPAVARGVPSYIEGTGSFVADETTDVAPKVSGQVVSTFVNVGDFVQRGQVVARLDDKDARLRLEQSKSALNQAEVAVRQAAARLGISANGRFDPANSPEVQSAYQNYLALVIVSLVVAGAFSYTTLGINLFPQVDLPTVAVTVTNPGASPTEKTRFDAGRFSLDHLPAGNFQSDRHGFSSRMERNRIARTRFLPR